MPANADLIRGFVEAMNRHDPDAVLACYAADARIVYPGREPQAPADYVAGERAMLESVPDYRIEATSILEAGDHVVLELRAQGRQRSDLGGRSFSITGAYIFRLAAGRIVEERAYPDIAGLRRQLSPR
jgi:ketosteroid isomerase-like protein